MTHCVMIVRISVIIDVLEPGAEDLLSLAIIFVPSGISIRIAPLCRVVEDGIGLVELSNRAPVGPKPPAKVDTGSLRRSV